MPDALHFIGIARQQGYSPGAAQAAFAAVRARLSAAGVVAQRFYIYRTGDGGVGGGDGAAIPSPSERPRLLLAFQSADDALAFAQGGGLGASPRLASLTLSQALAVLIQRPAIGAILIADESDGPARPGRLPSGTRIERDALVDLLANV